SRLFLFACQFRLEFGLFLALETVERQAVLHLAFSPGELLSISFRFSQSDQPLLLVIPIHQPIDLILGRASINQPLAFGIASLASGDTIADLALVLKQLNSALNYSQLFFLV